MDIFNNMQSCTGTTDMNGEQLAKFRVKIPGGLEYFAKEMTTEQQHERRHYMRKIFSSYPHLKDLSDAVLDRMRLRSVKVGYLVEDARGYDFFLPLGYITKDEEEFRKVRAMMPFEFLNLTGKDFNWEKYKTDISGCRDMVNKYIVKYLQFKEKGMGLYIYSTTKGSGKTMLSCCLLNEIVKRYAGSVRFVNILDFLEMTKKGFNGSDEDVKAIHNADLLVIDDMGVQMSKEWIDTVLYKLINDRYIKRKPVIYTSNSPIDNLKMDDRILDRIECTTFTVKLPEESIRKETRQQNKRELLNEITNAPSGSTKT